MRQVVFTSPCGPCQLSISPAKAKSDAGRVSRQRYVRIAQAVKEVLTQAIRSGGTTLRDFSHPDGARHNLAKHDRIE